MQFSIEYIKEQSMEEAKKAIKEGRLVSSETDIKFNGVHPDTGRDLDTVGSFVAGELEVWTLDQGLSSDEVAKIESVVADAVNSVLPEEMQD